MALVEWNAWALVYLVILVLAAGTLVGVLVTASRRPATAPAGGAAAPATAAAPSDSASDLEDTDGRTLAEIIRAGHDVGPYMAQFVQGADGERLGETIAVEGDRVVMKKGTAFSSVPQDKVRHEGGDLVAADDIDWDEAARLGEAWREERHKELHYDEQGNPVRDEEG